MGKGKGSSNGGEEGTEGEGLGDMVVFGLRVPSNLTGGAQPLGQIAEVTNFGVGIQWLGLPTDCNCLHDNGDRTWGGRGRGSFNVELGSGK